MPWLLLLFQAFADWHPRCHAHDMMGYSSSDVNQDLVDLTMQVRDLQRRVSSLEQRLGEGVTHPIAQETPQVTPLPDFPAVPHMPPDVLPVLGRALVAIAGAYVLRALSDSGVMPRGLGIAAGVLYALMWLLLATRRPPEARFAIAMTSSTSMLILGPLIWEACVRLMVISSWTSAAVLIGFAFIALAFSWRSRGAIVPAVVLVSSTLVAATLLLATDDLFPFSLTLLVLAGAAELAACRNYAPGARWISAAAADSAVLFFSWMLANGGRLPEGYVPTSLTGALAVQLLLIGIYITMAFSQTFLRRRTLSFPEMGQVAFALLIGIGGCAWVFGLNTTAMLGLGISCLIGGLASYALSFVLFERSKWNFRAWSSYGLLLMLAGTYLLFSGFWILWCGCAVVCCYTAMAARRPTLGMHGAVYLLLGSSVSGVLSEPFSLLLGSGTVQLRWLVPVGVLAAAILSWAAIARSLPGDVARWRKQAASFAISTNIVWILSGFVMRALIAIWRFQAERPTGHMPTDTLGTVVLTTFAVALAWVGTHWPTGELVWIAYGLMGLGGWKLVTRDFVNEHNFALVISLLFYGAALMFLPQVIHRKWPPESAAVQQ
jgi:hypothetical protein